VPISLGQEFSGYASAVEQDRNRIQRTAEGLCRIGIGGTAAGTGLNAHPEYHARMVKRLSELTGLMLNSSGNLFESMQSMADLVDFSAAMRTLAVTLTRIANDLRLLASGPATGLDEIRMPAVQPGSSIMPGKINPVMAEMLNMAMFQVIGCDSVVTLAAQAGQLELNVMMPVIACNLFDMQQIMIASILAFTRKCVTGIQSNPTKAASWLEHNTIVATALNPLIGYATGAALVKEAQERNLTIHDLAVEKAQLGLLIHRYNGEKVTVDEIEAALTDLRRMTEGGIFLG
jgi:fumarate hydratase class II